MARWLLALLHYLFSLPLFQAISVKKDLDSCLFAELPMNIGGKWTTQAVDTHNQACVSKLSNKELTKNTWSQIVHILLVI